MEKQIKTKIIVFSNEDLKKAGGFKKKNEVKEYDEDSFFDYLNKNKLDIKSDYIDVTGTISNGKRFRGYFNEFIIGTSSTVSKLNKLREKK